MKIYLSKYIREEIEIILTGKVFLNDVVIASMRKRPQKTTIKKKQISTILFSLFTDKISDFLFFIYLILIIYI